MKLFDAFRRKEAAGFSTEMNPNTGRTLSSYEIAPPEACNCAAKLGIAAPSTLPSIRLRSESTLEDAKEQLSEEPVSSRKQFHKQVVDKWLDLMNEPDVVKRTSNVNTLSGLQRTSASANNANEFQNHLLSHVYGAGMSHRDLGISDSELGSQFKESQETMQQAQIAAGHQPHFNPNDCGVCNQYLTALKSHVSKYKEHLDNASMMSTDTKPEDSGKSEEELLSDLHSDYMSGNKTKAKQSSAVAAAHSILGNWSKHLTNAHKYDFSTISDAYTPVVNNDRSQSFLKNLHQRIVQRLAPGWSSNKRKAPSVTVLKSEVPGVLDKRIIDYGGYEEHVYPRTWSLAKDGYNLIPRGKYYNRAPGSQQTYNRADDPRAGAFEEPVGGAPQPSSLGDKPVYNRGESRTKQPNMNSTNEGSQDYSIPANNHPEIIKPELKTGFAATLPREHKYLFQKAGVTPDTSGLEAYSKAQFEYENQPSHTLVDTGKTETTEEPQFERKQRLDEKGDAIFTDVPLPKVNPAPMGRPNSVKLPIYDTAPILDETGKQVIKTIVKPVYEKHPIPEAQKVSAPSQEMLQSAMSSYQTSLEGALKKVYPYIADKDMAIATLKKEHEGVVKGVKENQLRSLDPKNRRINASKEGTMLFNSGKNNQILSTIQSVKDRIVLLAAKENKAPCEKCGKNCKDAEECRTNVDDKRRQNAADNAWND